MGSSSPAVSCVGTLTWFRAQQCAAVRGNTGAIREETGAFISLSSVHLASITARSLYSDVCVCASCYVLAFCSHVLANYALRKPHLDKLSVI